MPDVALLMISTRILVSISDYFQEKRMTKFFKESILGPFCPNLGRNEFSWKKGLKKVSFYIFQLSTIVPTIEPFLRKNAELKDGQMYIWTGRQTETTVLKSAAWLKKMQHSSFVILIVFNVSIKM